MNFYGRYTPVTEVLTINATETGHHLGNCCMRFNDMPCTAAAPKVGFIDLGGVVFDARKFRDGAWSFLHYDAHCGAHPSHHGALVQVHLGSDLFSANWTYNLHPISACALYHNANPVSRRLLSGTYIDPLDSYKAGCIDMAVQSDFH